jgi:hypothetical protein
MPRKPRVTWGGSLHTTFRLLPEPSGHLLPFLTSDGSTPLEVLKRLPYDPSRSKTPGTIPDSKRYRDPRHLYEMAGLLYESDDSVLRLTELGFATRRWVGRLTERNVVILGRHAAYALSACQLRTPIGVLPYDPNMTVFPFSFIWRAMLALDHKISSDELNRAIFRVTNETELADAIEKIRYARTNDDLSALGDETLSGDKKNDRIIPWISIASFGWTLLQDKRAGEDNMYSIPDRMVSLITEAAAIRHRHREFETTEEYVEHVSRAAALPPDLR